MMSPKRQIMEVLVWLTESRNSMEFAPQSFKTVSSVEGAPPSKSHFQHLILNWGFPLQYLDVSVMTIKQETEVTWLHLVAPLPTRQKTSNNSLSTEAAQHFFMQWKWSWCLAEQQQKQQDRERWMVRKTALVSSLKEIRQQRKRVLSKTSTLKLEVMLSLWPSYNILTQIHQLWPINKPWPNYKTGRTLMRNEACQLEWANNGTWTCDERKRNRRMTLELLRNSQTNAGCFVVSRTGCYGDSFCTGKGFIEWLLLSWKARYTWWFPTLLLSWLLGCTQSKDRLLGLTAAVVTILVATH